MMFIGYVPTMCTIELKKMEFKKIIEKSVWEQAWHHNFVLVSPTNPLRGAGQTLSFLFEWQLSVLKTWEEMIGQLYFQVKCGEAKFSMKEYHCSQTLELFLSIF